MRAERDPGILLFPSQFLASCCSFPLDAGSREEPELELVEPDGTSAPVLAPCPGCAPAADVLPVPGALSGLLGECKCRAILHL